MQAMWEPKPANINHPYKQKINSKISKIPFQDKKKEGKELKGEKTQQISYLRLGTCEKCDNDDKVIYASDIHVI